MVNDKLHVNCSEYLHQTKGLQNTIIVTSTIGIIGGIVMYFILLYGRSLVAYTSVTLILKMVNTVIDLLICLAYLFSLLVPLSAKSIAINLYLCRIVKSEFVITFLVNTNIAVLVLSGIDRYTAVIHSMYYFKRKYARIQTVFLLLLCLVYGFIHSLSKLFKTTYHSGLIGNETILEDRVLSNHCTFDNDFIVWGYKESRKYFHGLVKLDALLYFVYCYVAPIIAIVYLYSQIIACLKSSSDPGTSSKSVQQLATVELTTMFSVSSILFIICFSPHGILYFYFEIYENVDQPGQKYKIPCNSYQIGSYLILFYSCCNPYVTIFFRATYRSQLLILLTFPFVKMGFGLDLSGGYKSGARGSSRMSVFHRKRSLSNSERRSSGACSSSRSSFADKRQILRKAKNDVDTNQNVLGCNDKYLIRNKDLWRGDDFPTILHPCDQLDCRHLLQQNIGQIARHAKMKRKSLRKRETILSMISNNDKDEWIKYDSFDINPTAYFQHFP